MVINEGFVLDSFMKLIDMAANGISNGYENEEEFTRSQRTGRNVERYSYSSSAKAASNLIAVFPVLCSSNVKVETANIISKHTERKGVVSLQLALTAVNITNAQTGFDYLRKFHQNVTGGGTLDDYELMLNRYAQSQQESVNLTTSQTERLVQLLKESYTQFYEDDMNTMSINDFMVTESVDGYDVEVNAYKKNLLEADLPSVIPPTQKSNATKKSAANDDKSKKPRNMPEMRDSDVKKSNEAVPSLMIVRFTNNQTNTVTEFLIGIKAKLIPTDYMEILGKIYTKNKDGKGLVNLVRFTSGEIKFFKDFLFAIDQNRDDILAMKKKGSREAIWKTLESRAEKSKILLRQNKVNYASAITTVVITSEDADLLYKEENIDIRNVIEAKKFMQAYNLFGFVIVNESEEVAWFMYDEDEPYFEKIAYTMLERETSDGQYKKIVNLMAKMK